MVHLKVAAVRALWKQNIKLHLSNVRVAFFLLPLLFAALNWLGEGITPSPKSVAFHSVTGFKYSTVMNLVTLVKSAQASKRST